MKAVVLHEYGGPEKLKWEDFDDPKPGEGELLLRVAAVSVNPIDWKQRSGAVAARMPIDFPAILGRDVAGVVREAGARVSGFEGGERVMALTGKTYAELCVVKAADVARVPEGMDMTTAATLPLVTATGDQLVQKACAIQSGQTVLVTGALGSVGRCAVYSAKEAGAKVIAGVRAKQLEEAKALPGVVEAIALDDDDELAKLGRVDAIADTIGGPVANKLLVHVKDGGRYGSVVELPTNAELNPTVHIERLFAQPDAARLAWFADAVAAGKLVIPVERVMPMPEAAAAHTLGEKGGAGGKIVLVA